MATNSYICTTPIIDYLEAPEQAKVNREVLKQFYHRQKLPGAFSIGLTPESGGGHQFFQREAGGG